MEDHDENGITPTSEMLVPKKTALPAHNCSQLSYTADETRLTSNVIAKPV